MRNQFFYQSLATFRATQPDDATCLAALPEIVPTGLTRITLTDLNYYLLQTGLDDKIQAAAPNNPYAAKAWAYLNKPSMEVLDFNDPIAGQLFPALIATGVVTQAEIDAAKLALGVTSTRESLLGIAGATQADLDQLPVIAAWQAKVTALNGLLSGTFLPGLVNAQAGQAVGNPPTMASLVGSN